MARRILNSGLSAHRPRKYTRTSAPQPQAVTAPPADAVAVPDGMTKVADLEEWAGTDAARAQAVLDAENAKPVKHQRKTLVANMTNVILEA